MGQAFGCSWTGLVLHRVPHEGHLVISGMRSSGSLTEAGGWLIHMTVGRRLSSSPCRHLHWTAWKFSWHGSWFPPERVIQESMVEGTMSFMTYPQRSQLSLHNILFTQVSPIQCGKEVPKGVNTRRWGKVGGHLGSWALGSILWVSFSIKGGPCLQLHRFLSLLTPSRIWEV